MGAGTLYHLHMGRRIMEVLNLKNIGVRGVNSALHDVPEDRKENFEILNPQGQHSIACGINAPLNVKIKDMLGFTAEG